MKADEPTKAIAEYAASVTSKDLTKGSVAAVVGHHLDAIACALAGFNEKPCQIARDLARTSLTSPGCSVLGIEQFVAGEQAVFANATMVRQSDYNDSYSSIGGGHPSDAIPAIVAAAELIGATGSDVVRGIFVAYEIFAALADSYATGPKGWDYGGFISISAAMGAGSVFELGYEELANAVGMALSPSMALRSARSGELSNWKGSATAHSAMSGLLAARLARGGFTGPGNSFEGADGFHQQVPLAKEFVVGEPVNAMSAIERSSYKYFPAELHAQAIVEPLAAIHDQFRVEDVTSIAIETYHRAWHQIGGGWNDKEEKWHPTTRETADHSLPYVAVVSILDGTLSQASYAPQRIADPAVRTLLDITTVTERSDLTALWPDELRMEMTVTLRDGRKIETTAGFPPGHAKNPMTEDQLSQKFQRLSKAVVSDQASKELEEVLWALEDLHDLNDLTRLYRAIPAPEQSAQRSS